MSTRFFKEFDGKKLVPGSELCAEDQGYVLRAFVHRFTAEHRPEWASKPWKDGKPYPVQFASDLDWLRNTEFFVLKNGRLNQRAGECFSHATWPENPELRKA